MQLIQENISDLFLQAQKDFQFSLIFEQRRTTAAVIAGFGTLSQTVITMANRLEASHADLASALTPNTQPVQVVPSVVDADVTGLLPSSLGGQVVQMNRALEDIASRLR